MYEQLVGCTKVSVILCFKFYYYQDEVSIDENFKKTGRLYFLSRLSLVRKPVGS